MSILVRAIATFLAVCASAAQAHAESGAEFYKSKKSLTLIIASGIGGGYDSYARTFARYFGRHLPGNPTIITQNMEGASGLEATNFLVNKAPRDGTVILATYNSLLLLPLLDNSRTRYDVRSMNWIGSIATAIEDCFTWYKTSIKTIEQAKSREVLMGATGATGDSAIFPKLLNKLTGARFKIVSGYSTNAQYLAIESGEIEGSCGLGVSTVAASKPDWVRGKKMNILVQFGLSRSPDMDDAPLATDLVDEPLDKKIFELLAIPQQIGRPIVAPPDVPAQRVKELREAFDATMKDSDFLADSERLTQTVAPMTGEAVSALLGRAYATPHNVIARYLSLTSGASN